MQKLLTGSCLCGGIQYECHQIDSKMANCHCSMCRKFHGAAFATYANVALKHFRWSQGESLLREYRAENGTLRQFCSSCGSSLSFTAPEQIGKSIEISTATLDVKLTIKPDAHIFVDFKADWYDINDILIQYPENRRIK